MLHIPAKEGVVSPFYVSRKVIQIVISSFGAAADCANTLL